MQSNLQPKEKITVSVRLINSAENVTIEFAVTDTGIGIQRKLASILIISNKLQVNV
jgi:signal transduction histidine kinase